MTDGEKYGSARERNDGDRVKVGLRTLTSGKAGSALTKRRENNVAECTGDANCERKRN